MKTLEVRKDYLFAQYTDPYELEPCLGYMKEIGGVCKEKAITKVLCDVRGMQGKINVMDSFQLAVAGAVAFRGLQVAGVYRREDMDLFAETVIRNRGGNVRVFSGVDEAKAWLGVE